MCAGKMPKFPKVDRVSVSPVWTLYCAPRADFFSRCGRAARAPSGTTAAGASKRARQQPSSLDAQSPCEPRCPAPTRGQPRAGCCRARLLPPACHGRAARFGVAWRCLPLVRQARRASLSADRRQPDHRSRPARRITTARAGAARPIRGVCVCVCVYVCVCVRVCVCVCVCVCVIHITLYIHIHCTRIHLQMRCIRRWHTLRVWLLVSGARALVRACAPACSDV